MKSIPGRILRAVAAAVGAGLLVLIAPHRSPWEMEWLPVRDGSIRLELLEGSPALPAWVLLPLALAVALAAAIAARPAGGRGRGVAFAAVAVALFVSLAPASPRGRGVVLHLLLGAAGVALLAAAVARRPIRDRVERAGARLAERVRSLPRGSFLAGAFVLVLVPCLLGSIFVLGRVPHVVDASAQLFHAKILASGGLWAPEPEPPELFEFKHMIRRDGRWYSQYPPGHIALLALGLLARVPWLVNPLLAACCVVLLYFVGREAYDDAIGRWAALFAALSPFVWIMAASFMSHTPMLLCFSLFLLGYVRMAHRGRPLDACIAGLALGYGMGVRPMTAAAMAVPFALHALARLFRRTGTAGGTGVSRARFASCCVVAIVAFGIPLGVLLGFNQLTNGDPLLFGYEVAHGKEALPGFGHAGWWNQPHTPLRGLSASSNLLNGLNQYLFGIPGPSLLLPLLGLVWARRRIWDGLLACSAGCLLVAHFFYWYQDCAYGPRFLHAAVAPLALLTARALAALPGALEERFPGRRAAGFAGIVLVMSFGYAWLVNVPSLARFYSRNYEDGNAGVAVAIDRAAPSNAVVLVPDLYYASVFARNDPRLEGPVVYARDLGPALDRRVRQRYPGRTLYRLRSLERYTLRPVHPDEERGPESYLVQAGVPLTVEGLSFQLSHFAGGRGRNRRMGEAGAGWRNHDQLWVTADRPGIEVGFLLEATVGESRTLIVALTRSAESGVVEIRLNGELLRQVDLYARTPRVERVTIEGVPIQAGRNALLLRVTGKNAAAALFGMGLDYFRLE